MTETLELQGRSWPAEQIEEIGRWITDNPGWSRYRLSRELCTPMGLGASQRADGGHGRTQPAP